jgi:hypothetical protein
MSSRSSQPGATAGFVEDNWPDAASMADTKLRLALKLGLILLWSGRLVRAAAEFDSPSRPRSVADHARLEARGVPPVVSLIGDVRAMLSDPATAIGFVKRGRPGWFNWTGRHIPDDERVLGWISPSSYERPAFERPFSAGQVQETELDTAMILLSVALWEYEPGHDEPFNES